MTQTLEQRLQAAINAEKDNLPRAVSAPTNEEQPQRSFLEEAVRKAEFAARGFSDSALETLGAIPDAVSAGMRFVGMDTPEAGYYTNALKQGFRNVGETVSAPLNAAMPDVMQGEMSTADKAAYGGGRGAADAGAFFVPAAAATKLAKSGTTTQGVAKSMASQKGLQTSAGVAGGSVYETTENPYLAFAASMATPVGSKVAREIISPVGQNLSRRQRRAAKKADEMGVELTTGQLTGNKNIQLLESVLANMPFSGTRQQALYEAQRKAINRSALEKAGINADNVDEVALNTAFDDLGREFSKIEESVKFINVDDSFFAALDEAKRKYGRRLPRDVRSVFDSFKNDLDQMRTVKNEKGVTKVGLDGETFANISSDLKRVIRQNKTNPDLVFALRQMDNALETAFTKAAPKELASQRKELNKVYRNLHIINETFESGAQAARDSGDISTTQLRRAVKRNSPPRELGRGRGEFADELLVGDLTATKIPDSGTAQRSAMQDLVRISPVGGVGVGVGYGVGVDPVTGLAISSASLGLPPLLQRALQSDLAKRYLSNTVAKNPNNTLEAIPSIMLARMKNENAPR